VTIVFHAWRIINGTCSPRVGWNYCEGAIAVVRGGSADVGNWHLRGLGVEPAQVCLVRRCGSMRVLCRTDAIDPKLTGSEQDAIAQDNRANVQRVVADRHRGNRT